MGKIKVGIVNYLNALPLLHGLETLPIAEKIELISDYPSRLASMLSNKEIDLGLVPVASLSDLDEYYIIGNHCIATEGEIASVALFSDVPLNNIKKVYLDYQSRTSAALLKYLIYESWGIKPEIIHAENENYRELIKGTSAGLVIGDRAFEQRRISTYIYDLGSEWKALTGLPFVFAAWVSNRRLPETFIKEFDEANAAGLHHIDEIVDKKNFMLFDLRKYYKLHVSYTWDERKKKGMEQFLRYIGLETFLQ